MADPQKLAEQILQRATDTLSPLAREMRIMKWPAEFRSIVWGAVANHAAGLRDQAEEEHRATKRG